MKRIHVIISTFGPLHLMKSAEFISKLADVSIIQGWLPGKHSKYLVALCSKIVKRNLFRSFEKRFVPNIKSNNGIAIPEFYLWVSKTFSFFRIDNSAKIASLLFGFFSKKYIKDADIFHVRSGNGGCGAIEKAKKNNMKVIVDHSIAHTAFLRKALNSEYAYYGLDCGYNTGFWNLITENCKNADLLLVNSDFVKKTFVDKGFEENKIKVVYLGVRKDFLGLKKTYTISGGLNILFTGGFGIRKGARYILEAAKKLDELHFDYKINIVGNCESDEIKLLLSGYEYKNIEFIGFVPQDELKKYFIKSDIYLFPSLAEGCASSGMEAMAAGLPVIATYESGLPIESGRDGIIIDSKKSDDIVNAIFRLFKDNDLRTKLGRNASSKIASEYTWENYAEKVVNIYKECLCNND